MLNTSIIVLDEYWLLDSTRNSFYQEISKFCDNVHVFNPVHKSEEEIDEIRSSVKALIKKSNVLFVLSINNTLLNEKFSQFVNNQSVPLLVWFWDNPDMCRTNKRFAATKTLLSCTDFKSWKNCPSDWEFLTFPSCLPARPKKQELKNNILFIGSLWNVSDVAQIISGGMYKKDEKQLFTPPQIFELIQNEEFFEFEWEDCTHSSFPIGIIYNYLASLKRAKYLAYLSEAGLDIVGGNDWISNLWPIAPELIKHVKVGRINSRSEMNSLISQYKVNLNIFHVQNKNGGPNFRIFDNGASYSPIVSDYNEKCAEIFPHREAALYYHSISDINETINEAVNDRDLVDKITTNAADIIQSGHLVKHRVNSLFDYAGAPQKQVSGGQLAIVAHSMAKSTKVQMNHSDSDEFEQRQNVVKLPHTLYRKLQNSKLAAKSTYEIGLIGVIWYTLMNLVVISKVNSVPQIDSQSLQLWWPFEFVFSYFSNFIVNSNFPNQASQVLSSFYLLGASFALHLSAINITHSRKKALTITVLFLTLVTFTAKYILAYNLPLILLVASSTGYLSLTYYSRSSKKVFSLLAFIAGFGSGLCFYLIPVYGGLLTYLLKREKVLPNLKTVGIYFFSYLIGLLFAVGPV